MLPTTNETAEDDDLDDQPSSLRIRPSTIGIRSINPEIERLLPHEDDPPPPDPGQSPVERLRKADTQARALPTSPARKQTVQGCPLKARYALEVLVLDAKEQPLADIAVQLGKAAGKALSAKTNQEGIVRFEKLMRDTYSLTLPALDRDSWKVQKSEALADPDSEGDAAFGPPAAAPEKPPAHAVVQGDSAISIAAKYGLTENTIWDDPANAGLKKKRTDANVLFPGDIVTIPAVRPRTEPVETGKRYCVERSGLTSQLVVRFLDPSGKPRSAVPYFLQYERNGIKVAREGQTDGDGWIREEIPPETSNVDVVFGQGATQARYSFPVGHLDPVDEISGVQARLQNLGYYVGDEFGKEGPLTAVAIADFRREYGVKATGKLDDLTRKKLYDEHLS